MSKKIAVIGIDPGDKGAYCLLIPETRQTLFRKTTEDPSGTLDWFNQIQEEFNLCVTMIEKVHAIPGGAAKTTFNFGGNVREVNLLPKLAKSPIDHVPPKTWQKLVGLVIPPHLKGKENNSKRGTFIKKEVASIAQKLYPQAELHGPKGGLLDGRSDALMIAHYAARTLNIK